MLSAEWVARVSHLLQSRRNAVNVLLAIGLSTALGLWIPDRFAFVGQLSTTLQLVFVAAVFIAGYSVAVLVTGMTTDLYRFARMKSERRRAALALERRVAIERDQAEASLRRILPELTTDHYALLSLFEANSSDRAWTAVLPKRAVLPSMADLTRLLFITPVATIDSSRSLFQFTPAAATVVPPFLAERRRRMIASALARAGDSERSLLELFATPEPQNPADPQHPIMPSQVYSTILPLTRSGVLTSGPSQATSPDRLTETIWLAEDAVGMVEEFLQRAVARRSVVLDLDRVLSGVGSGSGIRSNPNI